MKENIRNIKMLSSTAIISFILFSFLFCNNLIELLKLSDGFIEWSKAIFSGVFGSTLVSLFICMATFKQSLEDNILKFVREQVDILNIADFEPLDTFIPYDLMYKYLQELENNKQKALWNRKIEDKKDRFKYNYEAKNKIINWLIDNNISSNKKEAQKTLKKEYEGIINQLSNIEFLNQYNKITDRLLNEQRDIKTNFLMVACKKYQKTTKSLDKKILEYSKIINDLYEYEHNILLNLDLKKKGRTLSKKYSVLFAEMLDFQNYFIKVEHKGRFVKYYNDFKYKIDLGTDKLTKLFNDEKINDEVEERKAFRSRMYKFN